MKMVETYNNDDDGNNNNNNNYVVRMQYAACIRWFRWLFQTQYNMNINTYVSQNKKLYGTTENSIKIVKELDMVS